MLGGERDTRLLSLPSAVSPATRRDSASAFRLVRPLVGRCRPPGVTVLQLLEREGVGLCALPGLTLTPVGGAWVSREEGGPGGRERSGTTCLYSPLPSLESIHTRRSRDSAGPAATLLATDLDGLRPSSQLQSLAASCLSVPLSACSEPACHVVESRGPQGQQQTVSLASRAPGRGQTLRAQACWCLTPTRSASQHPLRPHPAGPLSPHPDRAPRPGCSQEAP